MRNKHNRADIIERAVKTFVQAFLGVLIPEVVAVLSGGFPENFSVFWAVLSPVVAAALAAGISAVWNWAKGVMSTDDTDSNN